MSNNRCLIRQKINITIMKKILLPILCVLFMSNAFAQMTKEERSKAVSHLKKTNTELFKTVKGLSEAQLNFKATETSWSIAECVEHITITENSFFGTLKNEPDASKRSEVSFKDEEALGLIETRDQKITTPKPFEPTNQFGGYEGSLDTFKKKESLT